MDRRRRNKIFRSRAVHLKFPLVLLRAELSLDVASARHLTSADVAAAYDEVKRRNGRRCMAQVQPF